MEKTKISGVLFGEAIGDAMGLGALLDSKDYLITGHRAASPTPGAIPHCWPTTALPVMALRRISIR